MQSFVKTNLTTPPASNGVACPTTKPTDRLDGEALLQLSRRLDWRFLLPDPVLENVGYFGAHDQVLMEALGLFCTTLDIVDSTGVPASVRSVYDVAVVNQPAPATLRSAGQYIKPGGYLYVEVHGPLQSGQLQPLFARPRLAGVADYRTEIQRLGFVQLQAHWHWPNFAANTKIVPLDSPAALRFAFGQGHRVGRGRLKVAVGQWLVSSGLLLWLVPCFSIIARRGNQ